MIHTILVCITAIIITHIVCSAWIRIVLYRLGLVPNIHNYIVSSLWIVESPPVANTEKKEFRLYDDCNDCIACEYSREGLTCKQCVGIGLKDVDQKMKEIFQRYKPEVMSDKEVVNVSNVLDKTNKEQDKQ